VKELTMDGVKDGWGTIVDLPKNVVTGTVDLVQKGGEMGVDGVQKGIEVTGDGM
jgi:hypothetical protein